MNRFVAKGFYSKVRQALEPHLASLKPGESLTTKQLAERGIKGYYVNAVLNGMVRSGKYNVIKRKVGHKAFFVKK